MLRKILKISLIIICIGFISAFIRGWIYQNNKSKSSAPKENISQVEIEQQEIIDEEVISSILNSDEVKKESNNSEQNKSEKKSKQNIETNASTNEVKTNTNNNTSNTEVKTNEKTNANETKVETNVNNEEKEVQIQEEVSNKDTQTNQNDSSKDNTIIEDPVPTPTIDDEYVKLLEYVDYTADEYSICYSDSIDVALMDTVNIRNTACKQFAYKGELVGYKIQIFYRDGTYGYYEK